MGRTDSRRHTEQNRTKSSSGARAFTSRGRGDRPGAPPPSSAHPDPADQERANYQSAKVRTGIVSVNGQDVGVMHCRRP